MPKVTTIPATRDRYTALPFNSLVRRRVAGYARVSTDSDEQFTSYEAQIDYYKNYILSHPEWEFVEVYTDEGISGLGTKKRDGFNRMIADALAGKIDLIVTKSVSRFARNTVDSLTTIRELKSHGVECFFEKETIYTFDSKGELLLTIMSSLAQEESRSISENVTWGQRKRFSDGKVSVAYKSFLGYDKGDDAPLKINPEQAEVVRLIFKLYMEGRTTRSIAKYLEAHNIKTALGRSKWNPSTILGMLSNEKYKGDALLQKTYTADYLTKKMVPNNGEVPQYYVEGSHEAIIDPEEFDAVQLELARRKQLGHSYSEVAFQSKIVCADCGAFYGRKVWHSNDTYRTLIFQCNDRFKHGKPRCKTPHLTEDQIKSLFLKAYDKLLGSREQILEDCELIRQVLCDTSEVDTQIAKKQQAVNDAVALMEHHIRADAGDGFSRYEFDAETKRIEQLYNAAMAELQALDDQKTKRLQKSNEIRGFCTALKKQALAVSEWDDRLWGTVLDTATVHADGRIDFLFKCSTTISLPVGYRLSFHA